LNIFNGEALGFAADFSADPNANLDYLKYKSRLLFWQGRLLRKQGWVKCFFCFIAFLFSCFIAFLKKLTKE